MLLKKTVFTLLILLIAITSKAQPRLRRQIMDFEKIAKQEMEVDSCYIYPICGKGKKTGNTLKVELYFKQGGIFDDNDSAITNIAVSAWGGILGSDSTFKKVIVKLEIEKTLRLEKCFTILNKYEMGFCSKLIVTNLACVDGLCMIPHYLNRPI